jgi:hypothetical protein
VKNSEVKRRSPEPGTKLNKNRDRTLSVESFPSNGRQLDTVENSEFLKVFLVLCDRWLVIRFSRSTIKHCYNGTLSLETASDIFRMLADAALSPAKLLLYAKHRIDRRGL